MKISCTAAPGPSSLWVPEIVSSGPELGFLLWRLSCAVGSSSIGLANSAAIEPFVPVSCLSSASRARCLSCPVKAIRGALAYLPYSSAGPCQGVSTDLLHRHGYRDDPELWRPIGRLLRPLEEPPLPR